MKMSKKKKSQLEFVSFKIFERFLNLFPYFIIRKIISSLFVFIGYNFNIRRTVAENQLAKIFPKIGKNEKKNVLKKMYRHLGFTASEVYFGNNNKLFKTVSTAGWKNLEEAICLKKGVILASIHFGNWQLAGEYIGQFHKTSVIIKKQRNNHFHDYTYRHKTSKNVVLIEQKNALRSVLKLLKENFVVAIMVDQSAGKNGIMTDFLGYPASTYIGAAKIAIKTGAPIVPAIAFRNEDGSHNFIFEKMVLPENFSKDEEPKLMEQISKKLEKYIWQSPEQWFWVHRRWRGAKKAKK